jgi:TRAP-type C4-dicarboxylate transport system permease small subunit
MQKRALRVVVWINRFEDWFLILMLSVMVTLAVAQIIYRNLFDAGLVWVDPLLRVLVLWVALAGAVVATRTDNHIRIDFFTRYLSPAVCCYLQRVVYGFSIVVCLLIAWHALRFVRNEYEYATVIFGDIPTWTTQVIIPLGFFMMAVRYLMLFMSPPKQETR